MVENERKNHYGIVGLGPVGAIFAVFLKDAGHQVTILETNQFKVDHLKKNPLVIRGELNKSSQLSEFALDVGNFVESRPDVILICLKSSSTLSFLKQLKAYHPKEETIFVSCQNGIDVEELTGQIFSSDRSLRMVLNFGCNYVDVSEVFVSFCFDHFLSRRERCHPFDERIAAEMNEAGISTKLVENYKEEVFKKAILNSSLGTVCALTRMTMHQVMSEPELVRMVKQIVREAIQIGEKLGFQLDGFFELAMGYLSKGGNHKPSMLIDIENHNLTENEFHCGKLFQYAEAKGLEVPVIQTAYYLIKNLEKSLAMESYVSERKQS